MKTISFLSILILPFVLNCIPTANAQEKGSGRVVINERQVAAFDQIEVANAIKLELSQGAVQSVKVETDDNFLDEFITEVSNGTLHLSCGHMRNPSKVKAYVTVKDLSRLEVAGAAEVKGTTPIQSDVFHLIVSGAAKTDLDANSRIFNSDISGAARASTNLTAEQANTTLSGAATAVMQGLCPQHVTTVSGAASLKALELITDNTEANVSGAGKAKVLARKQLKADLSGASSLLYFENQDVKKIAKSGQYLLKFAGMDNLKHVTIDEADKGDSSQMPNIVIKNNDDTVTVSVDDNKVVVVTDDTVKIKMGRHTFDVGENGIKIKKDKKKQKFNGHWSGLDLGVNGLINEKGELNAPADYPAFDLNYGKSISVKLNLFEQNFQLVPKHLGIITGAGFTWNNYRLDPNVVTGKYNGRFTAIPDTVSGRDYQKSKLTNTYVSLPLLLEYQTNNDNNLHSFHIAAGIEGGLRLRTHSKKVYTYDGDREKEKTNLNTLVNPFMLDAVVRVGWGIINLTGNYSLINMFRPDKGPGVVPFSIGITLVQF